MNKKSGFTLLLLFFSFILCGDWKQDICRYLDKVHEFDKVSDYLEANLKQIPAPEMASAIILLCYAYHEMGNSVNEEKWIVQYFEKHESDDLDFSFLKRKERVKIFEFFDNWVRKYPKVKEIKIDKNSKKVNYFFPPATLNIEVEVGAPAEILVQNSARDSIFSDYLHRGNNTIALPLTESLVKNKENLLSMVLKTGVIEIKKCVVISARYEYPEDVVFDPVSGTMSIRGKTYKKERSEIVSYKTKKFFNKKYFYRKALLNLGLGIGIFALNRLLISNQINQNASTTALRKGFRATTTIFAVGISIKGLINTIKSFHKEKIKKAKIIVHPEAVMHNQSLRKTLLKKKEQVFIFYELTSEGCRH